MIQEAKLKLRAEMDQNLNNPYIQTVGGYLLQHLEQNPAAAEKIMQTEKTIAKSLDEMKKEAEKKKVGNCAVLTDQEGFTIVLKYFGINEKAAASPAKNTAFDISLEDLL